MTETAEGIILRTRPLTETSLIVHWLTRELGRVATVAKGARQPKSTFRGKLDLFYTADFSFARSRRSELHILREVSLTETFSELRTDIDRVRQCSYCAALVEQTTETDTPIPEIYGLMRGFLRHASAHESAPQLVFAFELRLLRALGLDPDFRSGSLNPGSVKIAEAMRDLSWGRLPTIKVAQSQERDLRQFLHGFLIFHLGKIPANRNAAVGR
jgi:DNA repair protein RecO (recombination protein O)